MINVIITGPQGSGKSTMATLLCNAMLGAGYPLPKKRFDEGMFITTFRTYGNVTEPWSIETRLTEHPDDTQAVKRDLTRLFEILATTEQREGGDYKPTEIVCSREVIRAELNAILSSLESWAKPST